MKKIDSKSKKFLITLGPILLLVIILSISYAYWRKSATQSGINQLDTLKCLDITFTDVTNAINLEGEYPIPDSEGMTKTPYTFKVTNNCDVYTELDINLEVLPVSTLSSDYVKVALNNTSSLLSSNPQVTPTIGGATSYIISSGTSLFPKDFATFDLRLWVDEATTTEQGANKTFQSKITVTASVVTMPVNLTIKMPDLPSSSYNTNFVGATWNYKLGGITINSLDSTDQKINLTSKTENTENLADYIMSLTNDDGVYNEPATDYRYEGENPDNWIMFNNELWRIIGVFDESTHGKKGEKLVKIIRGSSIGAFAWDKSNTNDWPASSLYNLLNTHYYNGTNEESLNYCYQYSTTIPGVCNFTETGITSNYYREMIENVTWKLGGIASMSTAEAVYADERGTTETSGYIGLMYASDYGYSVLETSCARTTSLGSYSSAMCGGKAWLRGEGYEWTLVPLSSSSHDVWHVNSYGGADYNYANRGFGGGRPSLYLKSTVKKLTGTGSISDPYIIIS